MLDDDQELHRQIRARADDDVAAFIAQLGSDVGTGVPPPPRIEVTEVSSQPELEFVPFGGHGSETVPAEVPSPPAPPTGCPTSITFNDIEFCCACTGEGGGDDRVLFYEDPDFGVINGVPFSLSPFSFACAACINASDIFLPEILTAGIGECLPEGLFGVLNISVYVAFIGGIWYVLLIVGAELILFYGSSANPDSISNEITDCTTSTSTFDNSITECVFSSAINPCSVAKNGTATLTF